MYTCSLPDAIYHITILYFIGRTYISLCILKQLVVVKSVNWVSLKK